MIISSEDDGIGNDDFDDAELRLLLLLSLMVMMMMCFGDQVRRPVASAQQGRSVQTVGPQYRAQPATTAHWDWATVFHVLQGNTPPVQVSCSHCQCYVLSAFQWLEQ